MHAFDEMFEALADAVANPRGYEAGRDVRAHYQAYAQWLATQSGEVMTARREEAVSTVSLAPGDVCFWAWFLVF